MQGPFASTLTSALSSLDPTVLCLLKGGASAVNEGHLLEVRGKDAFVPAAAGEVRGLAAMA